MKNQFQPLIDDKQKKKDLRESPKKDSPNKVSLTQVLPLEFSDQKLLVIVNNQYKQETKQYRRMFVIVSIIFLFCGLIITERLVSQLLMTLEIKLLIQIQEKLGLSYYDAVDKSYIPNPNLYLKFIGYLQSQLVFYLLFTHFFITFYVAFDAIMAIKIMYPSLLGYYIICVLQLIYKSPKPFWVSEVIVSFTCQKTYSCPSLIVFILLFILFYSGHLYQDKSMISLVDQSFISHGRRHRRRVLVKVIGCLFILVFVLSIYVGGLIFLDHIALGVIYCGLYYTCLLMGSSEVNNMIRRTALISDTSKKMIFRWMFGLGIVQMLVTAIHNFSDIYPEVEEMVNFLGCLKDKDSKQHPVPLFNIIGPNATFSETSVVLGFIGLIFGVSYTFRSCKNPMTWYEGSREKKIMRALIANVCMVPSWVIIYYQQEFLQNQFIYESGLSEFFMNAVHFLALNFFLFGVLPVKVFERYHLNKRSDSFVVMKKSEVEESRPFSFLNQ